MSGLRLLSIATVLSLLSNFTLAEAQVLARRNELTALLLECSQGVARLEVTSPDGNIFSDLHGDFGTILRSLRFILPQACPDVEKVHVKGTSSGELWFAGAAIPADDNWDFEYLYAPP